jgi:hypothetical protein
VKTKAQTEDKATANTCLPKKAPLPNTKPSVPVELKAVEAKTEMDPERETATLAD